MKHRSGQLAREGILLAGMVGTYQRNSGRHLVSVAVTESRQWARLVESHVTAAPEIVIERDLAQRHHHTHLP